MLSPVPVYWCNYPANATARIFVENEGRVIATPITSDIIALTIRAALFRGAGNAGREEKAQCDGLKRICMKLSLFFARLG